MATDKIRKYVLPNIPYLFIGWFCLKIGTAYRLAAGAGFGEKLLGLGKTIGAAFASFAPGLAPLDWFVGIVGAVGFRLLIYCKAKKAKKFRRDAEFGTARWGNEKDIKPFIDPKFENNMLLTATERLTMNTRPKNPANARNLNFCGIGSSGSGKTRFWLTPQLLQAHSSYVVVDPKGGVLGQVGAFLQRRGYKIKVFNSIDFSKSMHYNPLSYIRNEADILKFVNALITNTKGEGKEGDPFWTKAETLLYCALIAYIIFEGPAEDRNMNTLVDIISGMEVKEDDENYKNAVDYMFDGLAKRKPDCFAVKQYRKFKLSSGKTAKSILISCGARLAPFDIPQLREIMSYDELELDRMGDRRTATFSASATRTAPTISLWRWPFRRCSTSYVNGRTMFTADGCPIMCGYCGTRRPIRDRCPSLKSWWPSSAPVRSACACCISSWCSARPSTTRTRKPSSATWIVCCSSADAKAPPSRKYPRTGWVRPPSPCRPRDAHGANPKVTARTPSGWAGS